METFAGICCRNFMTMVMAEFEFVTLDAVPVFGQGNLRVGFSRVDS